MKTAKIILTYAICVILGGIIGYFKAKSTASLIAGTVSGTLLFLCSLLCFKKRYYAFVSALVICFLLEIFFLFRFIKTHIFIPAGLLSAITLAVLLIVANKVCQKRS